MHLRGKEASHLVSEGRDKAKMVSFRASQFVFESTRVSEQSYNPARIALTLRSRTGTNRPISVANCNSIVHFRLTQTVRLTEV